MEIVWLIVNIIFSCGLIALYYYLITFIKSSVNESIKHQFEVERQNIRKDYERERQKIQEDFERELHTIDRKDKYQLVALEKRLEIHQHALTLSIDMIEKVDASKMVRDELEKELLEFWRSYCLYLSNNVRMKFKKCMDMFSIYELYEEQFKHKQAETVSKMDLIINRLNELPQIIATGVDLEAMGNESFINKNRDKIMLEIEGKKEETQK